MKNNKVKKVYEDAVMGGDAPTGGGDIASPTPSADTDVVSNSSGISTNDVLGKDCDHKKHGYLGPGCFHVPFPVAGIVYRQGKPSKKKRKKTPYERKMKIFNEFELNRSNILQLHDLDEEQIIEFIQTNYDLQDKVIKLIAIAFYPVTSTLFVKFSADGKTLYVNADFDSKQKKFFVVSDQVFTGKQVIQQYRDNTVKGGFKVYVLWGGN